MTRPVRYPASFFAKGALRAPTGGVTIHGVDYPGGRFIPGDVADAMSDADRAKVEAGQSVGEKKGDGVKKQVSALPDTGRMESVEHSIASSKTEVGHLFGPDGSHVVVHQSGSATELNLTDEQEKAGRGGILTHNHPDGTALSSGDFWGAARMDLRQIRAVVQTPSGGVAVHVLHKPAGGWPPVLEIASMDHDASMAAMEETSGLKFATKKEARTHLRQATAENLAKMIDAKYEVINHPDKSGKNADPEEEPEEEEPEEEEEEPEEEPQSFADAYMAHESHEDANDHYIGTLSDDGPGELTPDAEEMVADNLAQYSTDPDDWATTVVPASIEGGTDTTAARILLAAVTKANIAPPPPFDPVKRTYHVFDLNDLDGDDRVYAGNLLTAFRPVFASADGSRVVLDTHGTSADEMLEGLGVTATDLDDEESLQKLFDHLADPSVRESDVPAAAKNFGRVSGTPSGGVADWDANAVDVYRPLSKTHFLLRRGNLNPDVAHGPKYEIVARADLPARSNLPPQFWEKLEATDPTEYDDTPASRKQNRADWTGERRSAKDRLAAFGKQFGKLKDRHAKVADKIAAADAHSAAGGAANLSYHSDDSPHGEAAARLSDATEALSDATDHTFEAPEFEASHVRALLRDAPSITQSDADSPMDYADALNHAADEAKSSYGDHSDALAESEAEVGEHLASLRPHYRAVAAAAADVIRTSRTHEPTDGIDADQARGNARQAVAALRLSRRMLKRLDRQAPEPKE